MPSNLLANKNVIKLVQILQEMRGRQGKLFKKTEIYEFITFLNLTFMTTS